MAREYKFRSWGKLDGFEAAKGYMFNPRDMRVSELGSSLSRIDMQYTGLKDVHGVDIYEGDCFSIDKRQSNGTETRVGIATVRWNESELCFDLDDNMQSGEYNIHWFAKNKPVIGNIYENPHTLQANNSRS